MPQDPGPGWNSNELGDPKLRSLSKEHSVLKPRLSDSGYNHAFAYGQDNHREQHADKAS